jgi:multicomponent Na+:H+ antiporter subunit D
MTAIWTEAFWKRVPRTSSPSPYSTAEDRNPVPSADRDADGQLVTATAVRGTQDAREVSAADSPQRIGILLVPISGLALLTVALGLGAEGLLALAMRAADQLLEPTAYIQAVLGEAP